MTMRAILSCLLGAFIYVGQSNVYAESPSFSYVEFEYIAAGDIDIRDDTLSASVDTDGFALSASLELGIFFAQVSRFELKSDTIFDSTLEDSISTLALGVTFALPRTALYGLVRGRNDDISIRGELFEDDVDGTSIGAEVGARINVTDRLEINANLGKPSFDAGSSFGVGAQFRVTEHFGLTFDFNSIEIEEDDIAAQFDTTSIGVRFSF